MSERDDLRRHEELRTDDGPYNEAHVFEMEAIEHRFVARHHVEKIAKLEAELAAARERATWQPIETAPKDGTIVDLWFAGERITNAKWERGAWRTSESHAGGYVRLWDALPRQHAVTHWMPLPAAPTSAAHTGEGGEYGTD